MNIDVALANRLLDDQHKDLGHLPVVLAASGWDNRIFRLGDELALRLPLRQEAVQLLRNEQDWLPRIAASLPLAAPVPLRTGSPTDYYPWPWSVVPWLKGEAVGVTPFSDPPEAARMLAAYVKALHRPSEGQAPVNPWRGCGLAERDSTTRRDIANIAEELPISVDRLVAIWDEAVSAPQWTSRPILLHGDLHPLNILATGGELSAIIDFGDITDGDPACDLMACFYLFEAPEQAVFWSAADSTARPIDDDLILRAKGWTLSHAAAILAHGDRNSALAAIARKGLDAVC